MGTKRYCLIIITISIFFAIFLSQTVITYADYSRASESVNLRETPSIDAKVLCLVPMGYEIVVQNDGGEWAKVVFGGLTGYIKSEYIEVVKGSFQAAQNSAGEASASGKTDSGANGGKESESGVLRYGSEGEAVRDLQKLLTEKGIYAGPINGKFGPLTEEAVMAYQEETGLEVDGEVGAETMKKLTEKPHPAGTYRYGDEGDGVTSLQKKLKEKAYYSGPVNGKFGPLTEEAVRSFQKANGLEVDGIAGKSTLELLNAPPKSAAKPANSGASEQAPAKSAQVAPNGVEYIEWSEASKIISIGWDTRVYDVRTGTVYYVRSFSNGKHADVEPITTDDTALLKSTFGGVWSWDPRPVWVTVNGRTFAASINGMPHGGGVNSNNGMDGQICLHFHGSSTHNGNKAYAQLHQNAIDEAWNAAKK